MKLKKTLKKTLYVSLTQYTLPRTNMLNVFSLGMEKHGKEESMETDTPTTEEAKKPDTSIGANPKIAKPNRTKPSGPETDNSKNIEKRLEEADALLGGDSSTDGSVSDSILDRDPATPVRKKKDTSKAKKKARDSSSSDSSDSDSSSTSNSSSGSSSASERTRKKSGKK